MLDPPSQAVGNTGLASTLSEIVGLELRVHKHPL